MLHLSNYVSLKVVFTFWHEIIITSSLICFMDQDIELGESIIFGATAHHRISLAEDQCLIDYLKKMNKYTSCLRFELWTYISALNTKRDISSYSYQYRLKMSNDLNVDIPNDKKQENRSPHMKQKKKCIGFAVLPIKDLLCPFKMTSEKLSSLKVIGS